MIKIQKIILLIDNSHYIQNSLSSIKKSIKKLNQKIKAWGKTQIKPIDLKLITYSFATRYISVNSIDNLTTAYCQPDLSDAYNELYHLLSKSQNNENVPIIVLISSGITKDNFTTNIKLKKLQSFGIFKQSVKLAFLYSNFGQSNFTLLQNFTSNQNNIFKETNLQMLSKVIMEYVFKDTKIKKVSKSIIQKITKNNKRITQ